MKEKIKKDRWAEDTMILISRKARASLRIKAALKGITLKELIENYANAKTN